MKWCKRYRERMSKYIISIKQILRKEERSLCGMDEMDVDRVLYYVVNCLKRVSKRDLGISESVQVLFYEHRYIKYHIF